MSSSDAERRSSAETWEENDDEKLLERSSFTGGNNGKHEPIFHSIHWSVFFVKLLQMFCQVIGHLIGQKLRTSYTV